MQPVPLAPHMPLRPMQPLTHNPGFAPPQQMMYTGPSPMTQGVYSSYSARIKGSQDNALLLPTSYLADKKHRMIGDSDDDFEEMLEDNSENEDGERQTRATAAAAAASAAAAAAVAAANNAAVAEMEAQQKNLPKVMHKRNMMFPQNTELLHRMSEISEILVPVRLDIDLDDVKLRDVFVWNMNEQYLTPEMFAELLCEDLQLDPIKFIKPIAESIRAQVVDFEAVHEIELPQDLNQRVEINLDLQIGKVNLRDKFEWDLNNVYSNAPEVFSRQLASELGLGGEYVGIIAHGIRDQLFRHRKRIVEEFEGLDKRGNGAEEALESGFRKVVDAQKWAPKLEVLSNDELEKLLIAQERNIRRLRRETRFKRNTRRSRA